MSFNLNISPSPARGEGAQVQTDDTGNIAIRVQTRSECYHLYDAPRDRLKQFVIPKLHRAVSPLKRVLGAQGCFV